MTQFKNGRQMASLPTAAIIGAGISGLTTGKNLADAGVEYDCFESSDRIGGNWAFRNPNGHSSAYRSLHIDTSRECLSFRDFPMRDDLPDFPHHSQIKEYPAGGLLALRTQHAQAGTARRAVPRREARTGPAGR
ncbi:hypothetical protein BHQ17_10785 [Mycolicibacterium holsaticum]|uniref:Amine oxidase domain-containing protein n=1 Tax=Mycolicibacterium holsaticum TaxID=152142 RepID=A0A1E3RVS7_9MYCO|nr:hypothetical protein BHQ17_10785 [Mycolicibacterium holsaticum]